MEKTYSVRVIDKSLLLSPALLRQEVRVSQKAIDNVVASRQVVENILMNRDPRILGIVGPCAVHSTEQMYAYAREFLKLKNEVADTIFLMMRVYFEKPRTGPGWEGFIKDPYLNGSNNVNQGLVDARQMLIDFNEMGIPCATEILSQIVPERIGGLLSWDCIGARTVESPVHRDIASALSASVAFKNTTTGSFDAAINAIKAAAESREFEGHDEDGKSCWVRSSGNPFGHLILRGGKSPNYDPVSVAKALEALENAGLRRNLIIDCSHGNSGKDHKKQRKAWHDSLEQILLGTPIVGLMLESSLEEGKQEFIYGETQAKDLSPNLSIMDSCIGIEETCELVLDAHKKLLTMKNQKAA